jgi:bacteriocin-like protein
MNTNSPKDMRELSDNEMASVAGGVLGAIPGYEAPLPWSLFASGATCTWHDTGGYPAPTGYGTCQNSYY